jgi:hypothetical protein
MATSDENAAQRNVIDYCVKLKKRPTIIDNMENIIFYQDNAPCYRSQETQIKLDVMYSETGNIFMKRLKTLQCFLI